jgi:acetyl esterase/lipase
MGGDSAGGNLALAVMGHILHPMDELEALELQKPLAGVMLLSPWISFREDTKSFTENSGTDICGPDLLRQMATLFLPEKSSSWSEPLLAEPSWWKGFPARSVLNIWGELEMLRDSVSEMGEKLTQAGVNVENVECPLHVHVDCVLDAQSGLEPGLMATKIWEWLPKTMEDRPVHPCA